MVHDDSSGLIIDLCVDAGVANKIDDPFLALILREAEASGKVPFKILALGDFTMGHVETVLDVYALMDLAVRF